MANTTGKKFGGRQKGTPNKKTEEIRAAIRLVVENNIDTLEQDLKELKPQERIKAVTELAKFVLPTLKAVTVDNENGITPVIITGMQIIDTYSDETS